MVYVFYCHQVMFVAHPDNIQAVEFAVMVTGRIQWENVAHMTNIMITENVALLMNSTQMTSAAQEVP